MDLGSGKVEARATLAGDTDLNGKVDVSDLGNLASSYGASSGAVWAQGDLNYDGAVNVSDLGDLSTNYGLSLNAPPAAGPVTASALSMVASISTATAVPEPGSIFVLGLGAVGLVGRRRRETRMTN